MNAIRCPECGFINSASLAECRQCHAEFINLPPDAYISVPPDELRKQGALSTRPIKNAWYDIPKDNKTGQRVDQWYRIYCGCLLFLSVISICIGVTLIVDPSGIPAALKESLLAGVVDDDIFLVGVLNIIGGIAQLIIYSIALFSPRKPWAWIYGVVLIVLGLITCFLPSIILLIFWSRPETRVYFGRKLRS